MSMHRENYLYFPIGSMNRVKPGDHNYIMVFGIVLEFVTPNAICSAMHILILSIFIGAASVVHTTCTR